MVPMRTWTEVLEFTNMLQNKLGYKAFGDKETALYEYI